MKKRVLIFGIIAVVLLLFTACAKKSAAMPQGANTSNGAKNDSLSISNSSNSSMDTAKTSTPTETKDLLQKNDQEKKIIRFCTLYIQENELGKLSESIQKKTNELGGYIESENIMEERLTTVIRIPSDKFDEFISFTEKGYIVKNKNITTDNITDSYVDNDARLKNLRAQEDQILTILKRANTVDEVLKVQAELYRIRGEAEALEAKKKSWDKMVDYATITINADKNMIVPDSKKTIIGGSEFFRAIGKGFSNTSISVILFVENVLIFIISNIIVIVILVAGWFFGYRWYKKRNKL